MQKSSAVSESAEPCAAPAPGLRERKKAQTRADLERAAVELALDRELDAVTIDDICARVPVSHRTFFNYFDCKEDALFGFRRAWGDRDLVARYLAENYDGSILTTLIGAVLHGMPDRTADPALQEARMLIASRNPGLVRRRLGRLDDVRTGLVGAVADLMERVDAGSPDKDVPLTAKAELLVVAVIGSVRIALHEWADEGAAGPPAEIGERARAIAETLTAAIGG